MLIYRMTLEWKGFCWRDEVPGHLMKLTRKVLEQTREEKRIEEV